MIMENKQNQGNRNAGGMSNNNNDEDMRMNSG